MNGFAGGKSSYVMPTASAEAFLSVRGDVTEARPRARVTRIIAPRVAETPAEMQAETPLNLAPVANEDILTANLHAGHAHANLDIDSCSAYSDYAYYNAYSY